MDLNLNSNWNDLISNANNNNNMMKDIEVVIEVPVIHVNNKIAQYLKD